MGRRTALQNQRRQVGRYAILLAAFIECRVVARALLVQH